MGDVAAGHGSAGYASADDVLRHLNDGCTLVRWPRPSMYGTEPHRASVSTGGWYLDVSPEHAAALSSRGVLYPFGGGAETGERWYRAGRPLLPSDFDLHAQIP